MRRPQASFEAQPRVARFLVPKMDIAPCEAYTHSVKKFLNAIKFRGESPEGKQTPSGLVFPIFVLVRIRKIALYYVNSFAFGRTVLALRLLLFFNPDHADQKQKDSCGAQQA